MSEEKMNIPPKLIGNVQVKEFTGIDNRHKVLASATLEVAGTVCGPAQYLAICRDEDKTGYYLFFCNLNWEVWNDLWFKELQDAKEYVEINEYSGTTSTWEEMT